MTGMRFDGRVAVVTGAGGGLGKDYALLLASLGAKVVVNDLGTSRTGEGADIGMAQAVVDEIRAAGGEAVANGDSVATPEGAKGIIGSAIDAYGKIDILIHNATINRRGLFQELSFEDFQQVIGVHVFGGFLLAKEAYPRMVEAGYGRIILVASCAGLYGDKGIPAYATSKGALFGLANALAAEGGEHGVLTNCIVPAAETRLAEGRDTSGFPPWGPDLVSPTVAWLAHEDCKANGELFVALAGRVATAYVAETRGVYQPHWTVDDVAARLGEITDRNKQVVMKPGSMADHLGYSFGMAREG